MEPLPPLPTLPQRPTEGLSAVMHDLADALHYPVDSRGRVYDCRFLMPIIAFHLARCGARIHPELAVIKSRKLPPTPGVVEDAVEWVPIDAPDRIDDELSGATLDDVDKLSPAARAELIRRLGGDPPTPAAEPDTDGLWRVETSIHFDEET